MKAEQTPPAEDFGSTVGLGVIVERLEREAFDAWFRSEQGKPYDGMYAFALAAWKFRGSCLRTCRGVARAGCGYLAVCGSVCNKCGEIH